jgi:hypothetical protein
MLICIHWFWCIRQWSKCIRVHLLEMTFFSCMDNGLSVPVMYWTVKRSVSMFFNQIGAQFFQTLLTFLLFGRLLWMQTQTLSWATIWMFSGLWSRLVRIFRKNCLCVCFECLWAGGHWSPWATASSLLKNLSGSVPSCLWMMRICVVK